jgi:hypothetical protein
MPDLKYVPRTSNTAADALSQLFFTPSPQEAFDSDYIIDELMDVSWEHKCFYTPLTFGPIKREQKMDKDILRLQREQPHHLGTLFEDISKCDGVNTVVTFKDPVDQQARIVVPQSQQLHLLHWYHTMLVHPGVTCLYNTLHQYYIWKTMQKDIAAYLKTTCHDACQIAKCGGQGFGKISLKDVETEPWRDIALDLSGPWKTNLNGQQIEFHSLVTIINCFTSWVEIIPLQSKSGKHFTNLIEQEWLCQYPRPSQFIYDQGGEFENADIYSFCHHWYVNYQPITVRNPRTNAIVERMH